MDVDARRVVAARFISRTGGEAAFFVGIWGKAAYEFDGTAAEIAWVIAALGLSALVGSALAGTLIDRFDPRRVLLAGEVLFVPVATSLVWADDLTSLTLLAGLLGLVSAPTYTAIASFPPFLTSDADRLARTNAFVESAGMAALISGTATGAALAAWVSIDAIFLFDAATSVVAAVLVFPIRLRQSAVEAPLRRSGWQETREGFRVAFSHERLRFYLLIGASIWLLFGLFSALEPLFYRDVLRRGPETIGWVNTLFGIGLVGGTLLAARLPARLRTARTVVFLVALNGLGSVLYVGTARLPVVVAGGIVWGFVIGMFAPLVRTMLHVNAPKHMVGRVMGVSQVLAEFGKLGPLVVSPALAAAFGVQPTLAASGSVLTVIGALVWRRARALDRTRTFPVEHVEGPSVDDEPISPMP